MGNYGYYMLIVSYMPNSARDFRSLISQSILNKFSWYHEILHTLSSLCGDYPDIFQIYISEF